MYTSLVDGLFSIELTKEPKDIMKLGSVKADIDIH